jgi:predicted anti-sigma-YlaC factor YlaD
MALGLRITFSTDRPHQNRKLTENYRKLTPACLSIAFIAFVTFTGEAAVSVGARCKFGITVMSFQCALVLI